MNYYFSLQFTRLKRWFLAAGFSPWVGIIVGIIVFVILSKYLFFKTVYAQWIYPTVAITMILNLGARQRNDQLKIIFNNANQIKIRIVENGIIALPFLIYLIYEQLYIITFGLFGLSMILAVINFNNNLTRVIPTPFKKLPFEFIIGFRKSILFILLIYFIIFKAVQVDNYNLGIVSFGLMYLIFMSFYFKPEPFNFVWIFNDETSAFLKRKITYSFICASILSAPGLIALGLFFPNRIIITVAVLLIGMVFLLSMILAKYSSFPKEMNLPQGILFGLSLWFPPMLLIVIPIFYKQSKRNLKPILE